MNPQIKKLIHKISKKYSNSNVIDNNNTNLQRRKFSFFRNSFSHNKLSVNSVKEMDYRNVIDVSLVNDKKKCIPLERNYSAKVISSNCKEFVNNDNHCPMSNQPKLNALGDRDNHINSLESHEIPSPKLSSHSPKPKAPDTMDIKDSSKRNFSLVAIDSNINNGIINSSNSVDMLKFILRRVFNYPNNFYICLSYIITMFLLLSTLYVAYQVDRLETNLVRLIEKNQMKNLEKNHNSMIPDLYRNRQLLISQIEKLSQLMKTVQRKLS